MDRKWLSVQWGSVLLLLIGLSMGTAAADSVFELPEVLSVLTEPILVTTCGQSPGALMVALICEGLGLACEERDLISADELEALCESGGDCPIGNMIAPYNTLFVTTGTSLKGMGAAGVNVEAEIARCEGLIDFAKRLGVFVIVGQVEGGARRTDDYDEQSIRAMSPLADLLITHAGANTDDYFSQLAEELEIPQVFIEQTIELKELLPLLFGLSEPGEDVP